MIFHFLYFLQALYLHLPTKCHLNYHINPCWNSILKRDITASMCNVKVYYKMLRLHHNLYIIITSLKEGLLSVKSHSCHGSPEILP